MWGERRAEIRPPLFVDTDSNRAYSSMAQGVLSLSVGEPADLTLTLSRHALYGVPMKRFPLALLATLLFVSAVGFAQTKTISGRIVRVVDGDTVILRQLDGREATVRVHGIDAPVSEQPHGEGATKYLTMLALDKEVTADCPKKDQYGRLVCRIISKGADVGQSMLWAGWAWHCKFYQNAQTEADRARYASAEDFAREGRLGLWADASAVAPWEYRQSVKNVREEVADPSDARPQEAGVAGAFLGNRSSGIYHWPGCPNYSDIAPGNRVPFSSREEAERAGYRAARNCKDSQADASTEAGSQAPWSSTHSNSGGTVQVKGYYRKDGTYVRPHTRRAPRRRN